LAKEYISPLISIYMPVWENSKDEINHLKNILEIQNNLISNLLKMNQGLYDQLTNYKKEIDKAVVADKTFNDMMNDWLTNPPIKFPKLYIPKQNEDKRNDSNNN
jgi:hypothetical protein